MADEPEATADPVATDSLDAEIAAVQAMLAEQLPDMLRHLGIELTDNEVTVMSPVKPS